VQGGAPGTHDLAVIKLKAPKTINLKTTKPPVTKRVIVQIQNRSPHPEIISNLTDLVSVTLSNLQDSAGCTPEAVLIPGPPNKLPKTLKSKGKLNVFFEVTYSTDCVPDLAKSSRRDPGHEDFSYQAHANHAAIDGNADTHTDCDVCPRGPLPGGVDPNPDPTHPLKDKGCGNKDPITKLLGADVKTDVVLK